MQNAVPVGDGGMAAILGLDDDAVRAVCAEASAAGVVEAVNFNAPTQVVIAGHKAGVEKACEVAKAKGAKRALPLPVSAPFHSSLLKPASDQLREYLASVDVQAPAIPVINNVDVADASTSRPTIKDALVRQAAGPVRWVESVQAMARARRHARDRMRSGQGACGFDQAHRRQPGRRVDVRSGVARRNAASS